MARTPQYETERPRRLMTGVTLVAAAMMAVVATSQPTSATQGRTDGLTFANGDGTLRTIGMDARDADGPFFRELGTNGRTCATCHRPAQAWSVTSAELRDRFDRTEGLDPIFR